jgi:hypothetical protein
MRKTIMIVAVLAALGANALPVRTQELDIERLRNTSARFDFMFVIEATESQPVRLIYADARQHVHVYRFEGARPVVDWEATGLGSRATALVVRDTDADGSDEIIIATAAGRIAVYNAQSYDLIWENLDTPFQNISCLTAENIDDDPQDELIFVADSRLHIFDGLSKSPEWQSQREFAAREIVLGNVDDDDQLEVVLNSGIVFDTRFYNVEFEADVSFGDKISLVDINGDEIPEVVGETGDYTVRIFDIYAERELW